MFYGYHPKRECLGVSLGPQAKQVGPVTLLC